jgi:hypothetical protein
MNGDSPALPAKDRHSYERNTLLLLGGHIGYLIKTAVRILWFTECASLTTVILTEVLASGPDIPMPTPYLNSTSTCLMLARSDQREAHIQ